MSQRVLIIFYTVEHNSLSLYYITHYPTGWVRIRAHSTIEIRCQIHSGICSNSEHLYFLWTRILGICSKQKSPEAILNNNPKDFQPISKPHTNPFSAKKLWHLVSGYLQIPRLDSIPVSVFPPFKKQNLNKYSRIAVIQK